MAVARIPALFVGFVLVTTLASAAVEKVAIRQASLLPPDFRMYVDIRGDKDGDVKALPLSAVTARFGGQPVKVNSFRPFAESGEGVALVFAVDVSRSLDDSLFHQMREGMASWIDRLGKSDRVAILAFGDSVQIPVEFTGDKDALKKAIAGLAPKDNHTQLHAGIREAIRLAGRLDKDLPRRRAILLLSDGKDEGSGLAVEDVLEDMRVDRIPIYAIGASTLPPNERENYLEILHRIALRSGGSFEQTETLQGSYDRVRATIDRVWVADFDCSKCPADGHAYPVSMEINDGNREAGDQAEVTARSATDAPPRSRYAAIGIGVALLLALGMILVRRMRESVAFEGAAEAGIRDSTPLTFHSGFTESPSGGFTADQGRGVQIVLVRRDMARDERYAHRLLDAIIVGRSEGAGLRIEDREISRQHCKFELVNGHVVVSDLDSKTGTSVNGIPVQGRQKVESGDIIGLGRAEFRVHVVES